MEEQSSISKLTRCGFENNLKSINQVRIACIRAKEKAHLVN